MTMNALQLPDGYKVRIETIGSHVPRYVLRHKGAYVSAYDDKQAAYKAAHDHRAMNGVKEATQATEGDEGLLSVDAIQERISALSNELAGLTVCLGDWDDYLEKVKSLYDRRAALISRVKGYHLEEDSQCPY